MTQLILRALNPFAFFLIISIGIAIQCSLFASYPINYLQPDIVLFAVIWCALKRNFFEGGVLTLLFANMTEIHSGAPKGLFLCTYMFIFLMICFLSTYFVFTEFSALIGLTLFSSIVWKLSGLGILFLLDEGIDQWRHTVALLLPGAIMESVFGVLVYRFFEKFDWKTYKNPRARQLTEEDLVLDEEGL